METEVITKELQAYNTTDAAIAKIRQDYMALTIAGMEDKEGYDRVHVARMDVKNRRVQVSKKGKELREDAVKFQKAVIAEEKRIIDLMAPIEDHLAEEESRVDEEKERIRREAVEKEAARLQARVNRLFNMGCRFDGATYTYGPDIKAPQALIKVCTDEQFEIFCGAIQAAVDKDTAEKAEVERIRKEESARLAQVAREQEAERQRLAKETKALQNERDRIEREKREAEEARIKEVQERFRAQEIHAAEVNAAEKARLDVQERIRRDAEERAKKEEAARIRAEKREARRPDKEKLLILIGKIGEILFADVEMKTPEGEKAREEVNRILFQATKEATKVVEIL